MISMLLLFAIPLVFYALGKWNKNKEKYFQRRNVKYFNPSSLFGVFFNKFSAADFAQLLYQGYPDEPIYGMSSFNTPQYLIRDPDLIKRIGVKDFDYFEDHNSFASDKQDKLWGNNLFFTKGAKWRNTRAMVSPAFTGSKMRQMFELVADSTEHVIEYFWNRVENGEKINLELKDFYSRTLLDSIASCAFGLKVDSFAKPENEFFTNSRIAVNLSTTKQFFKIVILSSVPTVARWLGISLMDKNVERSFQNTVLDTMKIRKEKNIVRPDMINMMMELRYGTLKDQSEDKIKETESYATVQEFQVGKTTVNRSLSDEEITAQCFIFLAGGFEATSNVLMFASYELMKNPNIQQKLYEEILEMNHQLAGRRINYDELQKMKYLDQVVSETLRKWPPAVQVDRVCGRDYQLRISDSVSVNIEKGSVCLLPIYGLHYDPKYFPEPEKFDPERFSDENKRSIVSGTFNPFGIGPRNCIGSRFALMEIKAVLYNLLLKFSFEPNEKSEIPIKLRKVMTALLPENGLHLELRPRKN